MAIAPYSWSYCYEDIARLTGLSLSALSQHVKRGNLEPSSLESVASFLVRYGTPEVRLRMMERMLNIDRQVIERTRIQSTTGVGRVDGKIAATKKKAAKKSKKA